MRTFNEIIAMVVNSCNREFNSGTREIKAEVLQAAVAIYIEEMRLNNERGKDAQR